jgi:hypothetical protein
MTQDAGFLGTDVPGQLWADLRREGLLPEDGVVPG